MPTNVRLFSFLAFLSLASLLIPPSIAFASGISWTDQTAAGTRDWISITSSADGSHLAATDGGGAPGDIYTSSDGGMTWTDQSAVGSRYWNSITSSSDGTKLAAIENTNRDIWTSTDSGATWTDETTGTSASGLNWQSITSSSDGTKLAAVVGGFGPSGDIWTASLVSPPTVTTSAASSIGATSATGNGDITATGGENPETEGFVYGATTAYGATTTESGSFSTGAFTGSISPLTCNTAYHFAAYATNSAGTGYGSDQTFTTSACPTPAPSGGGGMIVGSGPLAPSSASFTGYTPPRPQIDYPNGTVVYLGATTTTSPSATAPTTSPTSAPVSTSSAPFLFTLNRQLWDEGPDILALQQWLNTHGFPLISTGWGSPGKETDTFGLYTYAALIKFQTAHNLPATGFFGPLTRAALAGMSSTTDTTSTAQ